MTEPPGPMTQDELFAASARLRPPRTVLEELAAQPGCPPEVRFLSLIGRGMPLVDMHCRITGDDRTELLSRLLAKLEAEA